MAKPYLKTYKLQLPFFKDQIGKPYKKVRLI